MSLIDTEKERIAALACQVGKENHASWQKDSSGTSFFNDISENELRLEEYELTTPIELQKKIASFCNADEGIITLPPAVAVFKLRSLNRREPPKEVSSFIYEF